MHKCEIVAEIGINHNGDLNTALTLIEKAKEIGADVAKFQTYQVHKLVRPADPSFELLGNLSLPFCMFKQIAKHCADVGIEFMSTPGDVDSLKFLVEECDVKRIKIGSDDMINRPLLEAAFATGLRVIISTGMATLSEIHNLYDAGFFKPMKATFLHCVSLYPCPDELANLSAIQKLNHQFGGVPVGYSDHTEGTLACVVAAAMGACMVEKHLMLAGSHPADENVSITPHRFLEMTRRIRIVEVMRGDGLKDPSEKERLMIPLLRKGLDGLRGQA